MGIVLRFACSIQHHSAEAGELEDLISSEIAFSVG